VTYWDSAVDVEIAEHLSHATFCLFLDPQGSLANSFQLVLKVKRRFSTSGSLYKR